jgi:hypothetical protein
MPTVALPLRLLRSALFAAVSVALSVAGHVLASGVPVPGSAVAVATVAVFVCGLTGAGRECRLPGLLVGMTAGQAALHAWFGWASARAAAHDMPDMPAMRHRHAGHESTAMIAAHLAVALLAALWLRLGESALFRLLARLDDRVRAEVRVLFARPAALPAWHTTRPRAASSPPLRRTIMRYSLVRRGPPRCALAP